jgi:DNA-binding response OmpR family regulator
VRKIASLPGEPDAARDADVIVLHCDRAKISSIELLVKLHRQGVNVPVVLLTGEPLPAHECLALDKGAVDVICKSRGSEVLGRRLKSAVKASTDQLRSGGPMICGKLALRPDVSRAYWKDVDLDLTFGEYNIVHLLASNVGKYVTYRAIYDRLHYEGFIAGNGADGYRANVRSAIKRIRNKFRACDPRLRRDRKLHQLRVLLEEARLDRLALPSLQLTASRLIEFAHDANRRLLDRANFWRASSAFSALRGCALWHRGYQGSGAT